MPKLVVFDIDGTLILPSKAHKEAFRELFLRRYHKDISVEDIEDRGKTDMAVINEMANKVNVDVNLEEAKALLIDFFKAKLIEFEEQLKLYDGVKELLDILKEKNVKIAIATGNLRAIAEHKLKETNILNYFCCIGTSDHFSLKEDIIAELLDSIGVADKKKIYYIGDTPVDITAAHVNNIKIIAITNTHKFLQLDKADFIVNSYDEIKKILV